MDDQSSQNPPQPETYTVSFGNGALTKLKELANALNIPENNLNSVIIKGIKLLDLANGGKVIIEKGKERVEVDLEKL